MRVCCMIVRAGLSTIHAEGSLFNRARFPVSVAVFGNGALSTQLLGTDHASR